MTIFHLGKKNRQDIKKYRMSESPEAEYEARFCSQRKQGLFCSHQICLHHISGQNLLYQSKMIKPQTCINLYINISFLATLEFRMEVIKNTYKFLIRE